MKEIPSFDIELSQAADYIMASPLAKKAFSNPPFLQYTNILRLLIQSVDRLADNCHMPEFTNHALPHICSIVRRASDWAVEDGWLKVLTEQEAGYLLLALVIHDMGMLSQDAQDLPDKNKSSNMKGFSDISNWVRRTHVIRLQGLVLRLIQEELELDLKRNMEDGDEKEGGYDYEKENKILLRDHMMVVIGMAASHQCWEWDEKFISNRDSIRKLHLDEERIGALNAVIAVCDLLDEDANRCDTIALIKYRHGTMENLAHWIRHSLTVEVEGIRNHSVAVTFRRLVPSDGGHEKIYRALRNHYRLVKLYNSRLDKIQAKIEHLIFNPPDGIPEFKDEICEELSKIWVSLPEFKNHIVEQILSTFMQEALNKDGGDAYMRRRLNRLGLETLDIAKESLFLEPPTTYFPDERILFGRGDFREQLSYIKDQVDGAYLDGNIGKLRHLCFTALQYWDRTMSLNDMYWVFTYTAVFQLYGNETSYFEYEYYNSLVPGNSGGYNNKLVMEGEYQPLLDVLLMLLKPAISEEWYENYVKHLKGKSYSLLKEDMATELLLQTIIGLLWYYNQEGAVWRETAEYLCSCLPKSLSQRLFAYTCHIEKLQLIINHSAENDMVKIRENCSHPLEKAWIDFWNDDWEKQEVNIMDMFPLAKQDRDYMKSVQGYLNLVRWNIKHQHDMLEQEKESNQEKQSFFGIGSREEIQKGIHDSGQKEGGEREDSNVERAKQEAAFSELADSKVYTSEFQKREPSVGHYRYNRIILEQPLPIFWEQRILTMESMLGDCRRQINNSQEYRIRLLHLVALHTLDALRYWDLWQFIDAIRFQTRLDFLNGTYTDKYGAYCGDLYALRQCFIGYIRGLDSKSLNKEERRLGASLLLKYEPEELDVIVHFIVQKSIPIQWQFAFHIVETFSKYFSGYQRKILMDWLIQYDDFYRGQNKYLDLTQYQFLCYWCKDMDRDDWNKVKPLIDSVFKWQTNMMSNAKLAEAVFQYAPWEWCMQYLDTMKSYPDNARKSYDFYSAVITMSKRKEKTNILQGKCKEDREEAAGEGEMTRQTKLAQLHHLVDWLLEDINEKMHLICENKSPEKLGKSGNPEKIGNPEKSANPENVENSGKSGNPENVEHIENIQNSEYMEEIEQLEDADKTSMNNLLAMKLRYEELQKLIDIDKLDQLEAVNLLMMEQLLTQMEQAIEKRGGLTGYDNTCMNAVKENFLNKNWNVEDEAWEEKLIDHIFSIMERYKESISTHFFVDLCHLLLSIENSCSNHIRSYVNHIVMENMVKKDFFLEQKKSVKLNENYMWDGPYKVSRMDVGSNNQYEIMVTLLLVSGMTALTREEQPLAIKYMTRALSTDETVIFNYATVMFSYYFLMGNEIGENFQHSEVVISLAWGGLQFILGRLAAETKSMGKEEENEVKNWVQKAIDSMKESDKWFKPKSFCEMIEENEEYREWLGATKCSIKNEQILQI